MYLAIMVLERLYVLFSLSLTDSTTYYHYYSFFFLLVTSKQQSIVMLHHAMYCANTMWQTTPYPTKQGGQNRAERQEKILTRKILLCKR